MDESLAVVAEKIIQLTRSVKSTTNELVILNIITCRYNLANKGSKANNIVGNFCKEDDTIKFTWQKSLDSRKHVGKDGIHLNNFGITQTLKILSNFWIMVNILILVMQKVILIWKRIFRKYKSPLKVTAKNT